jgi:ferredoxin, 2Fe-2S
MVKITFIDAEGTARTVEGEVGSTVMETAIKHAVPGIEAECGGACACSTCHVYIDEGWREKVGSTSPMACSQAHVCRARSKWSRRSTG